MLTSATGREVGVHALPRPERPGEGDAGPELMAWPAAVMARAAIRLVTFAVELSGPVAAPTEHRGATCNCHPCRERSERSP